MMTTTANKKATGYYPSSFLSPSPYPTPNQHNAANDVFPVKLYRLLEETTKNGYDDVISWSPDGMSFKVHDTERFAAEIMPAYFGSNKYRSFQKNLNMWSFKYIERRGKCYHPLFRRGLPHLICQMQRQLVKHQIERQQKKQELIIGTAAEIPKQRQNGEASIDVELYSLQSPGSDVNHNNSYVSHAYSTATTSSFIDKVKRGQEVQRMLSPSLLLADVCKKTSMISMSQEQQQWLHQYQIFQESRGSSPIEDNIIELHGSRGRFRATGDSSGLCPTRGDGVPSIISSLLDATMNHSGSPETRRWQKGTAVYPSISFGNVRSTDGVESPALRAFNDAGLLLSGLGGLSRFPASPVTGYVPAAAAESSPLLLSQQLQDVFTRKFLQAHKEQGSSITSLDSNKLFCTSTDTRHNPSFSRLQHHREQERLRTQLLELSLLPQQASPRQHTT